MSKEKNVRDVLGVMTLCLAVLLSISGCTSLQTTQKGITQLSGTWVGNVTLPLFGGRGNSSISQITFTDNTAEVTLTNAQGSFTAYYNYTVNGSTLVLIPTFTGRGGFPGQMSRNGTGPWNGTWPPTNGTRPTNNSRPGNHTRPGNWTRPENGTWNPGQRSMSISFTYRLNEDQTILYLNGAEFRKAQ